jgi:hypothetical protein
LIFFLDVSTSLRQTLQSLPPMLNNSDLISSISLIKSRYESLSNWNVKSFIEMLSMDFLLLKYLLNI